MSKCLLKCVVTWLKSSYFPMVLFISFACKRVLLFGATAPWMMAWSLGISGARSPLSQTIISTESTAWPYSTKPCGQRRLKTSQHTAPLMSAVTHPSHMSAKNQVIGVRKEFVWSIIDLHLFFKKCVIQFTKSTSYFLLKTFSVWLLPRLSRSAH